VLVVDDAADCAAIIEVALQALPGVAVETVTTAEAAWGKLERSPVSAVLTDLQLPGMTGMDIATALELRAPERLARVVFMTGAAFTPQAAAFVAAHPGRCVEKPFDVAQETRRRLGERR